MGKFFNEWDWDSLNLRKSCLKAEGMRGRHWPTSKGRDPSIFDSPPDPGEGGTSSVSGEALKESY